jgi:predicted  nucleic acid-binding Zn-ribbon protein
VDEYYELEMRSNYYDNLMKHLREITGQQDLQRIASEWQTVDSQVEAEYGEYLQLERQAKALREEREALERQYLRSEKEIGGESTEEERKLASVAGEVEAERRRVAQLEERLTALIDINSGRLTDEEIGQHVQRIRRRGDATAREL